MGAYCTRAVDMAGGRYLTLLIFLNDLGVGAGGNTTFPLAGAVEQPPSPADVKVGIQPRVFFMEQILKISDTDKSYIQAKYKKYTKQGAPQKNPDTTTKTEIFRRVRQLRYGSVNPKSFGLWKEYDQRCYEGLVFAPRKGDAVLFYNHHVGRDGRLGEMVLPHARPTKNRREHSLTCNALCAGLTVLAGLDELPRWLLRGGRTEMGRELLGRS